MQSREPLPQFTGLRGIAALLVLFYHIRTPQDLVLSFGPLDPFSKFGGLGVDIFFVLSGFVLTYVHGQMFASGFDRRPLWSFAVARFARIYPLHVVTLFAMLGGYAIAVQIGVQPTETRGYTWQGVISGLLLMQNWFGTVAPNPSSWSISVELANYLLFPFLMLARPLRMPRHWPMTIIVLGAVILEVGVSLPLWRGLIEFIMGCAAYTQTTRLDPKQLSRFAGLIFILPFLASYVADRFMPGLAAFCFALTMFLLSGRDGIFRRLCASTPLVFIGEISYSIYMLQWFVWVGWKHVLAKFPFFSGHPYLMVACAAASLIVVSIPSYYFFEAPARKFLRRALTRPMGLGRARVGVPERLDAGS